MNFKTDPVQVILTEEMIHEAQRLAPRVQVNRTVASPIDSLTGVLGEFVWAAYYFGDWKNHNLEKNKGQIDFGSVEIKTSAFRFNRYLNLLVREDYKKKRHPAFYVQIIIDIDPSTPQISPGTRAFICGFATASEVETSPLREERKKGGGSAGYRTHYIPILKLHPVSDLPKGLPQFNA